MIKDIFYGKDTFRATTFLLLFIITMLIFLIAVVNILILLHFYEKQLPQINGKFLFGIYKKKVMIH